MKKLKYKKQHLIAWRHQEWIWTQGLGSESISNLDNMSTIDGNKASINSYDEIKESLKNIGSAMLSTSRNISAVGYAFKGYDAAASNVFKSRKN